MKRTLYILGVVLINVLLLGFIFKVNHLPGAGICILMAMLLASFWFFPVSLVKNYKSGDNRKYRTLYIVAFISIFVDLIGGLFKIQHWPGANIIMTIGIPLPFILFLPAYIYHHNKNKLKADKNFFAIMFFMVYIGVISALLALNVSRDIIYAPVESNNSFNEVQNYLSYKNQSKYASIKNASGDQQKLDDLKKLQLQTRELKELIEKIQIEIIFTEAEVGKDNFDNFSLKIPFDLSQVKWKNPSATPNVLRYDYHGKTSKVIQLRESIEAYKKLIESIQNNYSLDAGMINSLFAIIEIEKDPIEEYSDDKLNFYIYSGFTSVVNLSGIRNTITMIENEILQMISKKIAH